ncbi:THAP domain-containing protein 6-like [Saccostrea cucullata]|uniref:THAP domain-containing protein 6-like n=1 Tax=Saccostrea cuccullata TaxID=36930 RepID=UPI002ED42B86
MPSSCCCVPGCANRGGHRFPRDDALRRQWIIAIKRDLKPGRLWRPSSSSVVCTLHFRQDDYIQETIHGFPATSRYSLQPMSKDGAKISTPSNS